jgi:selenocysteine lyase/cysteine desulfurase
MHRNRRLALEQRSRLSDFLDISDPTPDMMIGAMAALHLPSTGNDAPVGTSDPLSRKLRSEYRIQVPIFAWGDARLLRISAAPYNDEGDFDRLLAALAREL